MSKIITISRQFGSGGRTIGKMLSEKLGIPCYDQEIIEKIAEESGFHKDFIAERSEYSAYGGWFASAFVPRDRNGHSIESDLWSMQYKIITDLAKEGPCIIVGRCADYILKDDYELIKVFVYSDLKKRAERIVQQYGESDVEPEKRLIDKDKKRAAYYNFYTDTKWGDSKNYDICLNSGTIGLEKCADILSQLYAL